MVQEVAGSNLVSHPIFSLILGVFNSLKQLFKIIFLISFLGGCAAQSPQVPPPIVHPIDKEISLQYLCRKHNVFWQWDSVDQVVTLDLKEKTAKILVGSDIILMGGESIFLNSSVKMIDGEVKVSPDFEKKVFGEKRNSSKSFIKGTYSLKKVKKIIIDAGHGGKDPGAIGKRGTQEKYVVLDIAKRVERILKKHGLTVVMTRKKDVFVSLKKRTEIATQTQADLFVSIHANFSFSRGVQGIEVYSLKNLNILEKKERQRKINQKHFLRLTKANTASPNVGNIIGEMMYAYKQEESYILANQVAVKTAHFIKGKSRGAKQAHFYVLRNTLMPAILVEVGFLSNPKEEKLLKSKTYREKIAEGLARSIIEYVQ